MGAPEKALIATVLVLSGGLALPNVVPPAFEENLGQVDARARFYCRVGGGTLFLTAEEAVLSFGDPAEEPVGRGLDLGRDDRGRESAGPGARAPVGRGLAPGLAPRRDPAGDHCPAERAVLRLSLVGARPAREMVGEDPRPGISNYFHGNDPAAWRTGVRRFGRVRYAGVAPGVEMVYYVTPRGVELDLELAAGVDVGGLALAVEGAERVVLDEGGNLVLGAAGAPGRDVVLRKPGIYQDLDAGREWVCGGYELRGDGVVGFSAGPYERGAPLVVDPELEFSTYLGGSDDDWASGIALDATGSTYVTGGTASVDFPLASALQGNPGGSRDAFVAKIVSGTSLVYSTFLGGSSWDEGYAIAVDSTGSAYVTGATTSFDFPLSAPLQGSHGGGSVDAFVAKLDASGASLFYSTYMGGSDYDEGLGIAMGVAGRAHVTGWTCSPDFPLANPLQGSLGGGCDDAFVAELDANGTSLLYSTYLGGSDRDGAGGIAVDAAGRAHVTGGTYSLDFPLESPFQGSHGGGMDAFVTKLDPSGRRLVYSTYLGGGGVDQGIGIAVDAVGRAHVTGVTSSPDFPLATPLQSNVWGYDAFLTRLDAGGTSLLYSTYLGGSSEDFGCGIAVDRSGCAYVTGQSSSLDFPLVDPLQRDFAGYIDAFVAKVDATGQSLVYSTYLGGSLWERGYSIAVDAAGTAHLTGRTESPDFPLATPLQGGYAGFFSDAFVATIGSPCAGPLLVQPPWLPSGIPGATYTVALSATGGTPPYSFGRSGGELPPGLALSSAGVISGTPIVGASFAFTVTAHDAASPSLCGSREYVLTVAGSGLNVVAGMGAGLPSANRVRVFRADGTSAPVDFLAYGAGRYGVRVAGGDILARGMDQILTAPGPGPMFGPHVRGFDDQGRPLASIGFYAYGTLRYGAEVGAGDVDGDGAPEIVTGAGPGAVFGPHVRGFQPGTGSIVAMAGLSYYAYGTLKYGVTVGSAELDGASPREILTGPGPGAAFASQVRGFRYTGTSVTPLSGVSFVAFADAYFGARAAGGDLNADGVDEILATAGADPSYRPRFIAFERVGAGVQKVPTFDVTPSWPSRYGGTVAAGDLNGDATAELVAGLGPDPAAPSTVHPYLYQARPIPLYSFEAFSGMGYGAHVAAADLGYR